MPLNILKAGGTSALKIGEADSLANLQDMGIFMIVRTCEVS